MVEWLIFALIGAFTGIFAGLLGLGGGLIIVPALLFVFSWQGLPELYLIHMAIGTSLMTITITSLSSTYAHHQDQHVDWLLVKRLAPGLVIGSFIGAFVATILTSSLLQQCFAVYVLLTAISMWWSIVPVADSYLLNRAPLFGFSTLAGFISALVGIGGGSLVVPYLIMAKQSIRRAIGSSAACGFAISVAAVIGFMAFGQTQEIPKTVWQTGFIHWQAFLGIIATSTLFSFFGAKLVKHLPVNILKRLFSSILLVVAIYLFS
ncbi:MAG: sulfite exporter TauE/SafE family protein [Methylophagaceae bacterium]